MAWNSNVNNTRIFGSVWCKIKSRILRSQHLKKTPTFISQNSFKSIQKGIAEQLIVADLTSSTLTEKLRLLLSDQKYKHNAVVASKAFRDQKDSPLERGLWWIEWVLRNPDAVHFKSSSNHLSSFEIHSMDVIAFLTLVFAALTYGIFVFLRRLLKLIFGFRSEDNLKRKVE